MSTRPQRGGVSSADALASDGIRRALDLIQLARPQQWFKNIFVFAALLFSESVWGVESCVAVVTVFVCFCFWSSGIYYLNDVVDAGSDRQHPRKKNRPIAAGRIKPAWAIAGSLLLIGGGFVIAYASLPAASLVVGACYLVNSIAYCLVLKHRVIADVIVIAIGFVIRLIAGCVAIGVPATSWFLVCGFALALLLAFGKRRAEVENLANGADYRRTLKSYTPHKLDTMLGVSSAICLLAYMMYTVDPGTSELHRNADRLIYTVPFVAYGIFRYVFLAQEGAADGPTEIILKDPIFALNALLWLVTTMAVLYIF